MKPDEIKRFMAPGPWITRDLKPVVLAADHERVVAELKAALSQRDRQLTESVTHEAEYMRKIEALTERLLEARYLLSNCAEQVQSDTLEDAIDAWLQHGEST